MAIIKRQSLNIFICLRVFELLPLILIKELEQKDL